VPPVIEDAICIRQWDWSETSQTVTLFCRDLGVVRGLAKGSKRPKSHYSGGIELLHRGHAGVILRKNSDLALITEWDLTQTYPVLRSSLPAHNAGLYAADLIQQFVHDHDPHPALFDTLVLMLSLLREGEPIWRATVGFQWSTLVESGFYPTLDRDVRSGEPLDVAATYRFDPESGGLTKDGPGPSPGSWKVRAATVELLRAISTAAPGDVIAPTPDPETAERASRLLGAYTRHVLGHEPPTHATMFGTESGRG
jgi:DNA repair protein RecO (recombination protein O)